MTDEQRQEIVRRQAEGMRAMSKDEMARRQLEAADGARQRGPLTAGEQQAMNNAWPAGVEAVPMPLEDAVPPPPTLWARFKRWIRA